MLETTPWEPVPGSSVIYRASYKVPFNTTCSTLVVLGNNRYLVYSPGPGLESSIDDVVPDGAELLLVVPATGHYLGLHPWVSAHSNSKVFASEHLHNKILKKTKISSLGTPEMLADELPGYASVHVPPPHFLHEVWISVKQDDINYWLVGDAFLNFDKIEGNFIRKFLLGFYGFKPGLRLHKLFPLGLDKTAFRNWASPLFEGPTHHVLLPCHQDMYNAPDCGVRLMSIVSGLR